MRDFYGSEERCCVDVEEEIRKGMRWIMLVWTHPWLRGQGLARKMLTAVCTDADRENLTLYLAIQPGDANVTHAGLRRLYESVGFEVQYGNVMVRRPTTRKIEKCSSKMVTSQGS